MIAVYYQDSADRAAALLAMNRQRRGDRGRLAFLGSRSDCHSVKEELQALGLSDEEQPWFRALPAKTSISKREHSADLTALLAELDCEQPLLLWLEPAVRHYFDHDDDRLLKNHPQLIVLHAIARQHLDAAILEQLLARRSLLLPAASAAPLVRSVFQSSDKPEPQPKLSERRRLETIAQNEKLAAFGQLSAGVAHELGNPLSIISSSLQYLQQRLAQANDPASDFAMTALQNVDRMHALIRSLLDFTGPPKLRFQQTDLQQVISEVLRFTASEFARRGIVVTTAIDDNLPKIWVDASAIKQILLNLVKNSLDALLQKGNILEIRGRARSAENRIFIEVMNNGPPIAAEMLDELFRPFSTNKDEGTGLGLYLSKQLAKDHNGDLEAHNLLDGVQFTLTLPIDRRQGGA